MFCDDCTISPHDDRCAREGDALIQHRLDGLCKCDDIRISDPLITFPDELSIEPRNRNLKIHAELRFDNVGRIELVILAGRHDIERRLG